jgi:hypothetical protein
VDVLAHSCGTRWSSPTLVFKRIRMSSWSRRSPRPSKASRRWTMYRGVTGCGDTRQRTPSNASGKRVIAANEETPPVHR